MHSELQFLVDASTVLERVDETLTDLGIVATGEHGGYTYGHFCERFGDDEGVHLVWQLDVEPYEEDEEIEQVGIRADVTVSAVLFFGENSMFGVTYDASDGQWRQFLGVQDENIEVRPEAAAFAATFGATKVTPEENEADPIKEERAFEIVAAMAVYAKEHAPNADAQQAERRKAMN